MTSLILNLTAHAIVLANLEGEVVVEPRMKVDPADPKKQIPDPARVATTPGARTSLPGIPVPIVEPTTYGDLLGLPEQVEEGQIIVVSLPCAQAAAKEATEIESQLQEYHSIGGSATYSDEDVSKMTRRLAVLRVVCSPGQGKDIIPWTKEDAEAGRCPAQLVGLTRAVKALVRAVR